MMAVLLCLLALGALLGSATSDYTCILEQLGNVSPDRFFSQPDYVCKDIPKRFENVRSALKECSRHAINPKKMEDLYQEFCAPNSELKKEFDETKKCISSIPDDMRICMSNATRPPSKQPSNYREFCLRVTMNSYTCMVKRFGTPCGAKGENVIKHFFDASTPFITGMCYESVQAAYPGVNKGVVLVNTALMLLFCILLTMEWNR